MTPKELKEKRLSLGLGSQNKAGKVFGYEKGSWAKYEGSHRNIPEKLVIALGFYERALRAESALRTLRGPYAQCAEDKD